MRAAAVRGDGRASYPRSAPSEHGDRCLARSTGQERGAHGQPRAEQGRVPFYDVLLFSQ